MKAQIILDLEIAQDFINVKNTEVKKLDVPDQILPQFIKMSRQIQVAEKRYGILTLGSKSTIGSVLPVDTDVTVIYNEMSLCAHTHKNSIGRIDRLTALLKKLHVNETIDLNYEPEKNVITISKAGAITNSDIDTILKSNTISGKWYHIGDLQDIIRVNFNLGTQDLQPYTNTRLTNYPVWKHRLQSYLSNAKKNGLIEHDPDLAAYQF